MEGARVGSRRSEKRKTTTARVTKKLGRMAQLSIRHNDEVGEEFIDDLESGTSTRHTLGLVKAAFGGGAFSVRDLADGHELRASLRGLLEGRGKFHHNPEVTTAARVGTYVVLDGSQIMAVLSSGQASRARKAMGMSSARSSSGSKGFSFNRSSEERRNAARRAATLAGLNTRKRKSSNHKKTSSSWF
jgi:hypothetical protein